MVSSPVLAQAQTPYSPIKPSRAKLVSNGRFEVSPLKLPFRQLSVGTVAEGSAQNFEHVYDASVEEVLGYLQDPKGRATGIQLFDEARYPLGGGELFKLVGSQARREGGVELRFASGNVSRDFRLQVYSRQNRTVVKLINLVLTNPTSGVGPARVGFYPIGVNKELPFRWN